MALGVSIPVRDDDRALRRLLLWAMALGFIALLGAGVAAWVSTQRNRDYNALVDHTYQVREAIGDFHIALEQSETARRGYILTAQPSFAEIYRAQAGVLTEQLDTLAALTADRPEQSAAIARVRRLLAQVQAERSRSIQLIDQGARAEAQRQFATGATVSGIRAIRARLDVMATRETTLLNRRTDEQSASVTTFLAILSIAGLLVLVVAAVSLATVLRFTRDLGQSRGALQRLNDTLEDQVAERTNDLSRANDEIQRFAYIVSHDLRSPLVNVMGFTAELEAGTRSIAELIDRAEAEAPQIVSEDARLAAREDLPEAIGFIRTSTAKMDRLINAILKLSREGRRNIAPEPLDMAALVDGIRDTLRHRLDETDGDIIVEGMLPEIRSDRLAIEQVFANVIENAVKYAHKSRAIEVTVRGRAAGTRAIFEIADNGRGIDPRDHARVFDLFRRSGQQDQPGEGIGLAHVRALTYRLGGTIDVASTLGEGATFRIDLPLSLDTSGPTK